MTQFIASNVSVQRSGIIMWHSGAWGVYSVCKTSLGWEWMRRPRRVWGAAVSLTTGREWRGSLGDCPSP